MRQSHEHERTQLLLSAVGAWFGLSYRVSCRTRDTESEAKQFFFVIPLKVSLPLYRYVTLMVINEH